MNGKRGVSLILTAVLVGHAALATLQAKSNPLPGNGIFVGQTKVFDERSLALMYNSLQAKLNNRDFFDQGSIAAALGKLQGARVDTSSFGFNLTTTPIPGVSTKTVSGETVETNEKVTQAATQPGSTPGTPAVETTTKITSPNTLEQTITQTAVTPAAAPLPSQSSTIPFVTQSAFGLAPQTILSQQIELTHSLDNLRLMLEGSITDRVITAPLTIPAAGGVASMTGARSRAVVGFNINLDSPKRFENAVAEVEITITTQSNPVQPPSIVAVLPRENNYNVATVTKDAKQFGFGVAVQPINVGVSAQSQKETMYLVEDLDTVSFERAQPWNAVSPPAGSATFGWQFRPVLGQKIVKAGPRQVFAVLALPSLDITDFAGTVEARTIWRKYDAKRKTVGDVIAGSDSYQQLDSLKVPGVLVMDSEPLQPSVASLNWMDAGQGNILLTSRGSYYLSGMGIILGNQIIDNAEKGLFLQSDKSFRWLVSGQQVARVDDVLIAGRFGPPTNLRDPNERDDPNRTHGACQCLTITSVTTSPLDGQNSRVTVALQRTQPPPLAGGPGPLGAPPDFNPIVILGNKAYGFSDAPLVKSSNTVAGSVRNLVVEFIAPTQALNEATRLVARILFFGPDYTAERLATNFNPPAGAAFTTSKVVVLSSGTTNLYAITGTGFSIANVKVTVDGVTISPGATPGVPGAAGPNNAILTFNDSTLLTLSLPATLAKVVKQITLVQGGSPILLALNTPAPPPPKPKITSIEPVNVGDQAYVKVTGENLGSVDKALFQGLPLKLKNVADDGKSMDVLIIKEMTEAKGRRAIDFVSKDGSEVTGDLIVRP